MTIQLPDRDTRTYADILDEMIASIPKYTDKWTNHNPSDPGITILELLSWIEETTLYRINRIPVESYINFLRLVAGASGVAEVDRMLNDPGIYRYHRQILEFLKEVEEGDNKSIAEIKEAALRFLKSRYRAVTEDDFCQLAIEAADEVGRAIVYKSGDNEKVEIVIVSESGDGYEELTQVVTDYLNPRKLIGTIIKVKRPVYTDVAIDIRVVCYHYTTPEEVEKDVRDRILKHLDPFGGGDDGTGWPYGRPLTVYEIAQIIEETGGVRQSELVRFDSGEMNVKKIDGLVNVVSTNIEVVKEDDE
ncbi:MAG: baseplate J/gp47 family protein [Euryarchaeota archaeon]|nr:baseplate J/gp47 family protein [Euryarchaeota archaeon]